MQIRTVLALAVLALSGVACVAPESETLGVDSFDRPAAATDETVAAETSTDSPAAATDETVAAEASTCDVVREALLTGGAADIEAAMVSLKADTTADATAREYADYYLTRDAGDADMQEMDVTLIRMSCSI